MSSVIASSAISTASSRVSPCEFALGYSATEETNPPSSAGSSTTVQLIVTPVYNSRPPDLSAASRRLVRAALAVPPVLKDAVLGSPVLGDEEEADEDHKPEPGRPQEPRRRAHRREP